MQCICHLVPKGELVVWQSSLVNQMIGVQAGWSSIEFQAGEGIFYFALLSRLNLLATLCPIHLMLGPLFLGWKQPENELDHSLKYNNEVKNVLNFTFLLFVHAYFVGQTGWFNIEFQADEGIFHFALLSRLNLFSTLCPIHLILGPLFLGWKQPENELDHSLKYNNEVKNVLNFTFLLFVHAYFVGHGHWFNIIFTCALANLFVPWKCFIV